jgi:hypothetical protein
MQEQPLSSRRDPARVVSFPPTAAVPEQIAYRPPSTLSGRSFLCTKPSPYRRPCGGLSIRTYPVAGWGGRQRSNNNGCALDHRMDVVVVRRDGRADDGLNFLPKCEEAHTPRSVLELPCNVPWRGHLHKVAVSSQTRGGGNDQLFAIRSQLYHLL